MPGLAPGAHVERGSLVRVLAVAEHVLALPQGRGHVGPAGLLGSLVGRVGRGEPGGDGGIVGRRMRVGPRGQAAALAEGESVAGRGRQHIGVELRAGDHGDGGMVLGRRADHGRAADVDLLDALGRAGAAGHRLLERVQVRHQQLERGNPELIQLLTVTVLAQVSQQTRVHAGVQRLDPAVEALGEPGQLLDGRDRDAGRGDRGRRAAGGHDLHPGRVQPRGQLGQARSCRRR